MKALIIDDELKNRSLLKGMLAIYCPQVEVLGEASDGKEGLIQIRKLKPELVFLDIKMPLLDGFEMLDALGDYDGQIIFVTAYNDFAVKAIRYSAFDYLLKPVDPDELVQTMERMKEKAAASRIDQRIRQVAALLHGNSNHRKKISIPSADGITLVAEGDIIFLEASGAYTYFYLQSGEKILSSKNLKEYEDLLDAQNFFRCHHSYLVNLNHVRKYVKAENYLQMTLDFEVGVSTRKKDAFLNFLANWK